MCVCGQFKYLFLKIAILARIKVTILIRACRGSDARFAWVTDSLKIDQSYMRGNDQQYPDYPVDPVKLFFIDRIHSFLFRQDLQDFQDLFCTNHFPDESDPTQCTRGAQVRLTAENIWSLIHAPYFPLSDHCELFALCPRRSWCCFRTFFCKDWKISS